MKKFLLSFTLIVWLLSMGVMPVFAQTYRFQVLTSVVNIKVNTDGTASVEYVMDFLNDTSASPIDAVDIGLPTTSVDKSVITADVNGQAVSDISDSPYVKPGIALNLGGLSIQPGQKGRVHVVIGRVSQILHPGTAKETEKYASFQFSPTWFDSQYVHGNTDLTVTLTLPQGVNPNEPRYFPPQNWPGKSDPLTGLDSQGRVYYQWQAKQANSSTQYVFGSAFPARLVPAGSIVTVPLINLSFITDFFNSDNFGSCSCFLLFFLFFVGSVVLGNISARKRKLQYLPPRIGVEGHGIKRGLTAVEAAVLMEQPPDRIFTMILYAVVKKGAASVISKDPLKIQAVTPLPEGLRGYETDFLNAFAGESQTSERRALQELMVKLIKSVTESMKGFSRKETIVYYQSINEKAWQSIKAAQTPEVQMKLIDEEALDWAMTSGNFEQRAQEAFLGRPMYMPMWWGNYDPTYRRMGSGLPASMPSAGTGMPGQVSLPTLPGADFAASMVNGVQNFSGHILGDLTSFTGGVTDKTNPVPVSTSSSHGGGGGCACACACAGCACACAGGGR